MSDPIIIVGGGQAAVQLCLALRKEKVNAPVLMMSEESEYPYHRPPLSKSFLTGETDEDKLLMRPETFYDSKQIDVELNTQVRSIDTSARTVSTASGEKSYQSLVLVTGARPRQLPLPGASLEGVHLLRDLQHSKNIKSALNTAQHIVVVGAGFIGLEFAAVAAGMNKAVTVFDMADRVMARAVSPDVSSWFEKTHRRQGVDIRLNDSISEILGESSVSQVKTASGDLLPCDLLLIGVGVIPNDDLANAAGITCDNGIVVNEFCETSASDVYAAGDCANHPNPFAQGNRVRLESIQNATDQARVVASAIAGNKTPYQSVPWFWSDQAGHSLQMAGLSNSSNQFVVRGDIEGESFSVFHYSAGQLQSVDSVNSPRDHMLARKLIGGQISPAIEQAADVNFELKSLLL